MKYASFSQRLLAHNIDLIPIVFLFYLASLLPKSKCDLILYGLIYILYHCFFELSPMHCTPGKKWIKIYVDTTSENHFAWRIFLRNCLKPISFLTFFLGFFMIKVNKQKQGLHDYIAGTIVLFREE